MSNYRYLEDVQEGPEQRQFRNEIIRVADLTVNESFLQDYSFSNCRIIGPAVLLVLDDVSFSNCGWDAPDASAVFWEIAEERHAVVGAVGLIRCTFAKCSLSAIGLAGSQKVRETFFKEMGS